MNRDMTVEVGTTNNNLIRRARAAAQLVSPALMALGPGGLARDQGAKERLQHRSGRRIHLFNKRARNLRIVAGLYGYRCQAALARLEVTRANESGCREGDAGYNRDGAVKPETYYVVALRQNIVFKPSGEISPNVP